MYKNTCQYDFVCQYLFYTFIVLFHSLHCTHSFFQFFVQSFSPFIRFSISYWKIGIELFLRYKCKHILNIYDIDMHMHMHMHLHLPSPEPNISKGFIDVCFLWLFLPYGICIITYPSVFCKCFFIFYYIQKVPQADSERLPKGTKIITIIQITEEVKEHPDSAD